MTSASATLAVVIVGATSGIAEATARIYAGEGARLFLVGRNAERLSQIAADLKFRGAADVMVEVMDIVDADPESALRSFAMRCAGIDHVLLAYGMLPDQAAAETSPEVVEETIRVNLTSTAQWAIAAANLLERQGRGSLVVLGSPAGDRGRRRNYVYGMTKAGVAVLVEGIAHRFAGRGPRAVLIKPGPTATAMTAGLKNQRRLLAPPRVARAVRRAAERGGPVQYVPGYWGAVMWVIRHLPAAAFNRMDI